MHVAESPRAESSYFGFSFHTKQRTVLPFERRELASQLEDKDTFPWIDIQDADIGTLNGVLSDLGVQLVLTDTFHRPEILPRIVERLDCVAFYLYVPTD